jgi:hypothetical protein
MTPRNRDRGSKGPEVGAEVTKDTITRGKTDAESEAETTTGILETTRVAESTR